MKTYDLIQDYLNGNLSETSLLAFEKRMHEEADLRNYVENHKAANAIIKQKELNNIKSELTKIHLEDQNSGWSWKGLSIIALALLLGFTSIYFYDSKSDDLLEKKESKNEVKSNIEIHSEIAKVEQMAEVRMENFASKKEQNLSVVKDSVSKENGKSVADNPVNQKRDSIDQLSIKGSGIKNINGSSNHDILKKSDSNIDMKKETKNNTLEAECEPYSLYLELKTYPTCLDKKEGLIEILADEYLGDYTFSLNNSKSQISGIFSELESGAYTLNAIDNRGCISDPISAFVDGIECNVVIQPSQNFYWEIPEKVTNGNAVELEIYNARGGQLVYKNTLDSSQLNIWNGQGNNGEVLPMGAYLYIYIFDGKKLSGSLTIVQ